LGGLFWTVLTLFFDNFLLVPAARQALATRYPSTDGIILSSKVTEEEGEEGPIQHVNLEYAYAVGGRNYTGSRYRYDELNWSDSAWAENVVAAHPPGIKVKVFFDSASPQDSVLATGIHGSDLFHLAFMTPFNCAMLGFWLLCWSRLKHNWFKPEAGGVKIMTEPARIRVRLTPYSTTTVTLAATSLLAFLSFFVICFFAGGENASMRTMKVTWTVILSGGLAAGAWHALRIMSGKYDLVIDKLGGFLELPPTHGRKTRRRVPVTSVKEVHVETIKKTHHQEEPESPKFGPTLVMLGLEPRSERLVEWYDADKADGFVAWLRGQVSRKSSTPLQSEKL
jgi:hypothetical protein